MAQLKIDRAWVRRHADLYLNYLGEKNRALEEELFFTVGPRALRRGYLERGDLLEIAKWKSKRAMSRVEENDEERVKGVTTLALRDGMGERALTLTSLFGVGIPRASAILAVCFPNEHTPFDVNARWTLRQAGEIYEERVDYGLYLATCRRLSAALGPFEGHISDLRALDRALWKYAHRNM